MSKVIALSATKNPDFMQVVYFDANTLSKGSRLLNVKSLPEGVKVSDLIKVGEQSSARIKRVATVGYPFMDAAGKKQTATTRVVVIFDGETDAMALAQAGKDMNGNNYELAISAPVNAYVEELNA